MRCLLPVLLLLGSSLFAAEPAFVHARGKTLVDAKGQPVLLRGINLGNWLVPEGYMFKLPESTSSFREIDALVNELIGPEEAARFWKTWRERYITERDIQFISAAGFNSVRVPMHYAMLESGKGLLLLDARQAEVVLGVSPARVMRSATDPGCTAARKSRMLYDVTVVSPCARAVAARCNPNSGASSPK